MSTLTEIETAADSLSPEEKEELLRFLAMRLRKERPQPAPRIYSDEELAANPGLVKTMAVKPPIGTGKVRLIEIVGYDLQPCGGTHVRHTGEIGAIRVTQIEKKGKQNRRVRISFA